MAENRKPTSPTGTKRGEREQAIRSVPKSTSTRRNVPSTASTNLHPSTPKPSTAKLGHAPAKSNFRPYTPPKNR